MDSPLERRTDKNYNDILRYIKSEKKKHKGIKGPTLLSKLKFYSVSESIQIDLMHSVGLGVIKNLFEYWFDFKLGPYSLRHKFDQIEQRFMKIQPPDYLPSVQLHAL